MCAFLQYLQKFLLNKDIREENVITIPKPFLEGGVLLCLVLTKMLDGIILKHCLLSKNFLFSKLV
jgi:hypothetical protein